VAFDVSIALTFLDPAETPGIGVPFVFLYALHDALMKPLPGNDMAPCLAASWKESADGLVYEFKLREGLKFHNGDPFTAEDVKFSFLRYRGASANLLHDRVKAVDIVDPYRIRFVLHTPWPDFLVFYATPATGAAWIVPKKYIEKVGEEGFRRQPVGLGPYRFARMTPGVELVLEANEQYWRKRPSVKRVVIKSVPDRDASGHAQGRRGGHRLCEPRSRRTDRRPRANLCRNWEGHPCCSNIRASDPTFTRPPTSPPPPPSAAT
jgi:peptide/nickel transport system substrate-binding protein